MSRRAYFSIVLIYISLMSTGWWMMKSSRASVATDTAQQDGLVLSIVFLVGIAHLLQAGTKRRPPSAMNHWFWDRGISPFPNFSVTFATALSMAAAIIFVPPFLADAAIEGAPDSAFLALIFLPLIIPMLRPESQNPNPHEVQS